MSGKTRSNTLHVALLLQYTRHRYGGYTAHKAHVTGQRKHGVQLHALKWYSDLTAQPNSSFESDDRAAPIFANLFWLRRHLNLSG